MAWDAVCSHGMLCAARESVGSQPRNLKLLKEIGFDVWPVSNSLLSMCPKISLNQFHKLAVVNKDLDHLPVAFLGSVPPRGILCVGSGDISHRFLP